MELNKYLFMAILFLLVCAVGSAAATHKTYVDEDHFGNNILNVSNVTIKERLTSYFTDTNMSWINLTNHPGNCSSGYAVTGLGDAVTCTDAWLNSDGDNITGPLSSDSDINTSAEVSGSDIHASGTFEGDLNGLVEGTNVTQLQSQSDSIQAGYFNLSQNESVADFVVTGHMEGNVLGDVTGDLNGLVEDNNVSEAVTNISVLQTNASDINSDQSVIEGNVSDLNSDQATLETEVDSVQTDYFNLSEAESLGANLDANTKLITNIGNSGTDFNSSGGLVLADSLQAPSVGIGTNSPDKNLHVVGTMLIEAGGGVSKISSGNLKIEFTGNDPSVKVQDGVSNYGRLAWSSGDDNLNIDTRQGGSFYNSIATFDAGYVGINQTSPSSTLDVVGGTELNGNLDLGGNVLNDALVNGSINANSLQQGLVGFWGFDSNGQASSAQTAYDSSREGNDVTLGNSTSGDAAEPTWVAGKSHSALKFDGTDDFGRVEVQLVSGYPFAMGARFKTEDTDKGIVMQLVNSSTFSHKAHIHTEGNYVEFYMFNQSDTITLTGNRKDFTDGKWHSVVVLAHNRTYWELYTDRVLDNKSLNVDEESFPLGIDRFAIGSEQDSSPGQYFNGTIDEVKFWNRTLSVEEIRAEHLGLGQGATGHLSLK